MQDIITHENGTIELLYFAPAVIRSIDIKGVFTSE